MATGSIKHFGALECVAKRSNNHKIYMGGRAYGPYPYQLKFENYESIKLVNTEPYRTQNGILPLQWIESDYDGFKCYILKDYIYSYTSKKALEGIVQKLFIDGQRYLLTFMSEEFWMHLPDSICKNFNGEMTVIASNNPGLVTKDTRQTIVKFRESAQKGHAVPLLASSVNNEAQYDPCGFIPVLIPIEATDGVFTKKQMGLIRVTNNDGSNEIYGDGRYPDYPKAVFNHFDLDNYMASGDVTIVDDVDYNVKPALTWLETTYKGKKCYVYTSTFFRWGNLNDITSLNRKVIIRGVQYSMKPLPIDFWLNNDKIIDEIKNLDDLVFEATVSVMSSTKLADNYHYTLDLNREIKHGRNDAFGNSTLLWLITLVQDDNDPPTISGTDTDLGVKDKAFGITFSVNDLDPTQTLTVTEKLNGTKIRSFTASRRVNYLSNITDSMLKSIAPGGVGTYEISVTDGIATTTRTYTFTRKVIYPQINVGTNIYDLGVKDEPFEKPYFISYNSSDNYVITEMLNGKVLRVRNVTHKPLFDFVVGSDDFFALEDGSVNTLTIKVECAGLTAEKSMIFTKGYNNVIINGKDTDLGTMTSPFELEFWAYLAHSGFFESDYEASDFKIDVSVMLNDKVFYTSTLNELQHCVVNISKHMLNELITNAKNVIKIVAKYKDYTAERLYTFIKGSTAPTISGSNGSLGNKSKAFSFSYKVTNANSDQTISITESLNGSITRSYQLTGQTTINSVCHINDTLFSTLQPDETNTIKITASNGVQTVTRSYTFVKVNKAPVIEYTGGTNLGTLEDKPTITYKVIDAESDILTITEKLNGEVLNSFTANPNDTHVIDFPDSEWLGCSTGENTIEITASDEYASDSVLITFARKESVVQIELKEPIQTDTCSSKILISPLWDIDNATGKIEVCNNAFDEEPTWEDATEANLASQPYEFKNTQNTSGLFAINVRLTLEKNEGYNGRVAIYGFNIVYYTMEYNN